MTMIINKHSTVLGRRPLASELEIGELAINTEDGVIYFKSSSGELREIKTSRPSGMLKPKTFVGKMAELIYVLITFIIISIFVFIVKLVLSLL